MFFILFNSMLMKYRFGLMVIIMFGFSMWVRCRYGWLVGCLMWLFLLLVVKLVMLCICRLIRWLILCGKNVVLMLVFSVVCGDILIMLNFFSMFISERCVFMCSCL